jgi:DNA topoisomerase-2
VPVEIHKTEKVYVPELVFGHLLTSSNYDDKQKKVTGGRNGFGAKLANVFSKKFDIECADSKNRKLYRQTFKNNMSVKGEPVISEFPSDAFDYTCVSFEPDLKKFQMKQLDSEICSLFKKRVYDLAGCSPPSVSVYLNGKKI